MCLLFNLDRNSLIAAVLVVIIILFAAFIYINDINIPFLNWLSDLIYNLLTPIINLVHNIINTIKNFFITLFSIDEVHQEIEELRKRNSVLERQILFLENINRENKRLRELLDFEEKVDHQMRGAEVIANSPSPWEKTITINKGSQDGIENRMPVVTYNGYLVGRVESTGAGYSQVRLITDQDFVVGGIVARTDSREIGLVRGSGREEENSIMDNIAWDADIQQSDIILTSGLSNNFPSGLKIGEVISVENDNYGLSQKAEINLYINNITLEEVLVITNFNSDEEVAESIETETDEEEQE